MTFQMRLAVNKIRKSQLADKFTANCMWSVILNLIGLVSTEGGQRDVEN